jgi:hypothetical protein
VLLSHIILNCIKKERRSRGKRRPIFTAICSTVKTEKTAIEEELKKIHTAEGSWILALEGNGDQLSYRSGRGSERDGSGQRSQYPSELLSKIILEAEDELDALGQRNTMAVQRKTEFVKI